MNMKEDDLVSAVALVVESAPDNGNGALPGAAPDTARHGPDGGVDGGGGDEV